MFFLHLMPFQLSTSETIRIATFPCTFSARSGFGNLSEPLDDFVCKFRACFIARRLINHEKSRNRMLNTRHLSVAWPFNFNIFRAQRNFCIACLPLLCGAELEKTNNHQSSSTSQPSFFRSRCLSITRQPANTGALNRLRIGIELERETVFYNCSRLSSKPKKNTPTFSDHMVVSTGFVLIKLLLRIYSFSFAPVGISQRYRCFEGISGCHQRWITVYKVQRLKRLGISHLIGSNQIC